MSNIELCKVYCQATAIGDALGATTEFLSTQEAVETVARHLNTGYPWKPIGGGWLNLKAGETTDDTAMTVDLAKAIIESGNELNVQLIAKHWRDWVDSKPPDVGSTIRQVVCSKGFLLDPLSASRDFYLKYPKRSGNGSLMRNAVISALAPDLSSAFRWSLLQSAITHYDPTSILCCAIQTWVIWQTFEEVWPFDSYDDWLEKWHQEWKEWILNESNKDVQAWRAIVEENEALDEAMKLVCNADFDPDSFNPFMMDLASIQGWSLLGLQIGIWAMQWCRRESKDHEFPLPRRYSSIASIFQRRGHDVIGWLPAIGHDSDTYGAIAGPLIVSAVGQPFPAEMTDNLLGVNGIFD